MANQDAAKIHLSLVVNSIVGGNSAPVESFSSSSQPGLTRLCGMA